MKKHLFSLVLLLTSTSLFADTWRRGPLTPNQGPYVRTEADYARFTGDVAYDYVGGSAALGTNFLESEYGFHQVELQGGGLFGSFRQTGSVVASGKTYGYSGKVENTVVPVLINWNYSLAVSDKLHPYFGLTGGGIYARQSVDKATFSGLPGVTVSGTNSGFAPVFGVGIGLRYDITKNMELDFGYKHLRVLSFTRNGEVHQGSAHTNTTEDAPASSAHLLHLGLTFNF